MTRRDLGRQGEDHAANYLNGLGYRILHRNWRCEYGEIDLVAEHDGDLVIVEVRTRRGSGGVDRALESIGPAKQERLRRLAEAYHAAHPGAFSGLRIDVVAVQVAGDQVSVEVYPHEGDG